MLQSLLPRTVVDVLYAVGGFILILSLGWAVRPDVNLFLWVMYL